MNDSTADRAGRGRHACATILALVLALITGAPTAFGADGSAYENRFRADNMGLTMRYPDHWSVTPEFFTNLVRLVNVPANAGPRDIPLSEITVFTEQRRDHEDAVMRLETIASGMEAPESAFLQIGGWPAVQHGRILDRPKPSKASGTPDHEMYLVTTVIAAGDRVVRIQAVLPSYANPPMIAEARGISTALLFDHPGDARRARLELDVLRSRAAERNEATKKNEDARRLKSDSSARTATAVSPSEVHADIAEGFNQRILMTGFGEVEIAVSPDAQNIVVGRQGDWVASNDGGQTFPEGGTVGAFDGGDPSVAWAQSGAFYYAGIDRGCQPADTAGPNGYSCTGMAQSLDNGATFPLVTPAVVCPARPGDIGNNNNPVPGNVGCFPDQHHIAADRFNAGSTGGDQVYSVWRNFDEIGNQYPAIVCSEDSGQNWTAPAFVDTPSGSSFPRINVGQDGAVYVAYYDGGNFELRKYSSCANGLVPESIVTVGPRDEVECPFPGHDRCDQNPTSQMVAVDDTNPNHVYYVYGDNDGSGKDDVIVRDSLDGGDTWPAGRVVRVNADLPGNRIMPWVCTTEGEAYVTWYDRRAAPSTQNDATDFYGGRVGLNGVGGLEVIEEFRISEVPDNWCDSGWPCGTRGAPGASESCSVQPQLAGYCTDPGGNRTTRCDFSDCGGVGNNGGGSCQCVAGDVCNAGSSQGNAGGCPKYGDYNGNACMAGRLYASWASATSPPGVPPPNANRIGMLFDFFLLGSVGQVNVPASVQFGQVCAADQPLNQTLQVCNTGNANLDVNGIESSDTAFTIEAPSGGWPVTVSPDFCFPFTVNFEPDGEGVDTATLTVNTDDPATPEIAVNVTADVGSADINTFIASSGDFGEVCSGLFEDLNLTVQNDGRCDLEIDQVSLSGFDAGDFALPDGTLAGTVIEAGNSLLVPVRFTPDNFDDPNPRSASVDVESRTANGDALSSDSTPIEGTVPAPDLNLTIANSGDFGAVCKGETRDLDLNLLNQGRCDLTVTNISSDNSLFVLPADLQFDLVLSHDADFTIPVRYAPQDCNDGVDSGTITVASDSPGEESLPIAVSGTSPCPNLVIDQPAFVGDFAFPATVVDAEQNLGCYSERSTVIRNTGDCPLTIGDISASGDDFFVTAPSQFPIVLPPGEETLGVTVRFTPLDGGDTQAPDEITGTLTVTSDDPDAAGTAGLCGEGVVRSGIRVLVTDTTSGIPLAVDGVDAMTVKSKGKHTPSPINLSFTDVPLQTAVVCGNTVSWNLNLEQLPSTETTGAKGGKSQYEVGAREGNLQAQSSLTLGQCEFNAFQLQLQSSDGGDSGECLLLAKGEACTTDADCCSGNCKGRAGSKTCK